jgi:hypothetical protein
LATFVLNSGINFLEWKLACGKLVAHGKLYKWPKQNIFYKKDKQWLLFISKKKGAGYK